MGELHPRARLVLMAKWAGVAPWELADAPPEWLDWIAAVAEGQAEAATHT